MVFPEQLQIFLSKSVRYRNSKRERIRLKKCWASGQNDKDKYDLRMCWHLAYSTPYGCLLFVLIQWHVTDVNQNFFLYVAYGNIQMKRDEIALDSGECVLLLKKRKKTARKKSCEDLTLQNFEDIYRSQC